MKKLPKTTEQHSKDEKERKGTRKKKNLEGKRGLQKLTEKGEGAMGPVYGYFAPWLDHPRSDRSIHREIYIQRNIRHFRKATDYNTRLSRKRKIRHFKTQSTQLHLELGLKSIINGGPRVKTHFQKIMIRGSRN